MAAQGSLRLVDTVKQIQLKVNIEIAKEANRKAAKIKTSILPKIRQVISTALASSDTISSLSGGKLRGDFGIPKGTDVVTAIISAVSSAVDITISPFSGSSTGIKGAVVLTIQRGDYSNVLGLPGSTVTTEKGQSLPWLSWLLTLGDQVIVSTHGVRYKPGTGRSGQAQMKFNYNAPFKVDSAHSGKPDDNFITRTIDSVSDEITAILIGAFKW